MENRLKEMIHDVGVQTFAKAVYENMTTNAETPLYAGSPNFTRLSSVLRLINLKVLNGWNDKSFTELLQLLKEMLPESNTLPDLMYEAKKILCPMDMEYEKIHACLNGCILYRKYKDSDKENSDEVTKHDPPSKAVWYLPIIPRFKCMFTNPNDARNLR